MKRRKTPLNVNELFPIPGRRQKKELEKVQDEKGRPVRGLWQRKGVFYAQLCPSGQTQQYKYRLEHAQTVPPAITAMQVLKDSQQKGALLPPTFQKKQYTEENQEKNGHTIGEAIANYREHRDLLELFDPLTCERQNNSLNKRDKKFGKLPIANLNGVMRSDFAKWRKSKDGGKVSGRTIDNDMSALNHVVERAVELHWLPEAPFGNWKKLDKGPSKKARLLTPEELDTFCAAAFVPQKEMDEQHWPPEYQAVIRKGNQAFSDYFYLLAYSGAREKETRRQR